MRLTSQTDEERNELGPEGYESLAVAFGNGSSEGADGFVE